MNRSIMTREPFDVPGTVAPLADALEVINMGDVTPRDVQWLWRDRIGKGCLTLLAGLGSAGKGVVTMDICARITTGRPWPDGAEAKLGTVLLVSKEDNPAEVIRPRLDAAGADPYRVSLAKTILRTGKDGKPYRDGFTLADLPHLEKRLSLMPDCQLVIIDPIGSVIGGRTQTDKDNQIRELMQPLADLAERFNVAILVVAHYRKADATDPDERVMGSLGFVNIARNVWHVLSDEADGRRLLLAGKSNNAAQAPGLSFTVEGVEVPGLNLPVGAVQWQPEPVPMTALQWVLSQRGESKPGPKPKKIHEAQSFLSRMFSERIIIPSKELNEGAEAEGISRNTLKDARRLMGVSTWQDGKGAGAPWLCALNGPTIEALIASAVHRRASQPSNN